MPIRTTKLLAHLQLVTMRPCPHLTTRRSTAGLEGEREGDPAAWGRSSLRPSLCAKAQRLQRPLRVLAEAKGGADKGMDENGEDTRMSQLRLTGELGEGLSASQRRAFHTSSRVSALMRNCTEQSRDCMLPLVPPLAWLHARTVRTSAGEFRPHDSASANTEMARWWRTDEEASLNHHALHLHAAVGLLCVALLCWRLPGLRSKLLLRTMARCCRGR